MKIPTTNKLVRAGLVLALLGITAAASASQTTPSPEDAARQADEAVRETVVSVDPTTSRPGADPEMIKRRHAATRGVIRGAGAGGLQQLDIAPRGHLRDMCLTECKRLGHDAAKCEEGC